MHRFKKCQGDGWSKPDNVIILIDFWTGLYDEFWPVKHGDFFSKLL